MMTLICKPCSVRLPPLCAGPAPMGKNRGRGAAASNSGGSHGNNKASKGTRK